MQILVLLQVLSLHALISHSVSVVEQDKGIPLLVSCLVEQEKKKCKSLKRKCQRSLMKWKREMSRNKDSQKSHSIQNKNEFT